MSASLTREGVAERLHAMAAEIAGLPGLSAFSDDLAAAVLFLRTDAKALARATAAEDEIARLSAETAKLRPIAYAAHGLSFGEDWNNGVHAKLHGYRRRLLLALAEWKGRDASAQARAALAGEPRR